MGKEKTNCGIYQIKNLVNNKVYIGSSSNLKSRKYMHFYLLKHNNHPNNFLQNSINKYGMENFEWEVLKYVEKIDNKDKLKEDLLKWEQIFINRCKLEKIVDCKLCYNIAPKAGSNLGLIKRSKKLRKVLNKHTGVIYSSIQEATEACSLASTSSIYLSCKSKDRLASGCKWEFIDNEDTFKPLLVKVKSAKNKNKGHNKKKVLNVEDNLFFNSIEDAALYYKICANHISSVCNGKRKKAGKYTWIFYNPGNF